MKFLILNIFLMFSAFGDYALLSEVESGNVTKSFTSKPTTGEYVSIPTGYNSSYHRTADQMKNGEPNYEAASNIVSCTDSSDCGEKLAVHVCNAETKHYALINAENTSVYCTKVASYNQIPTGKKIVVIDESLKASYDASMLVKSSLEAGIQQAMKVMACGKRAMALMGVRNVPKSPTAEQINLVVSTFLDIKNLLEAGSYDTSREKILAVDLTGTIMNESDRSAMIAELDSCMGI